MSDAETGSENTPVHEVLPDYVSRVLDKYGYGIDNIDFESIIQQYEIEAQEILSQNELPEDTKTIEALRQNSADILRTRVYTLQPENQHDPNVPKLFYKDVPASKFCRNRDAFPEVKFVFLCFEPALDAPRTQGSILSKDLSNLDHTISFTRFQENVGSNKKCVLTISNPLGYSGFSQTSNGLKSNLSTTIKFITDLHEALTGDSQRVIEVQPINRPPTE